MNNASMLRKALAGSLMLPVAILAFDEPKEIPLWPNGAPGSEGKTDKEFVRAARAASAAFTVFTIRASRRICREGENTAQP